MKPPRLDQRKDQRLQTVMYYSLKLYDFYTVYARSNEARRPYGSGTRAAASRGGRDRHTGNEYTRVYHAIVTVDLYFKQ